MQRDHGLLVDIGDAARLVRQVIDGLTFDQFVNNPEKHWTVVSQLLIVGEAAQRLSLQFREAHSSVPWSQIARMRDKLIHHYRDIDFEQVWLAAIEGLPELLRLVNSLDSALPIDDATDSEIG